MEVVLAQAKPSQSEAIGDAFACQPVQPAITARATNGNLLL